MRRDRVFCAAFFVLLATLGLFAVSKRALVFAGAMTYDDVGNTVSADGGGAVEQFTAAADDIFINYLPFYNDAVRLVKNAETSLNKPVADALMNAAARRADADGDGEPSEGAPETQALMSPEEAARTIVSHTSTFLNATDTHRNYLVELTFADGSTGSFLDRVVSFSESKCARLLDESIEQIVRLTSYRADEVNWYLYSGSRFQDAENLSEYIPTERSTYPDLMRLFAALPDSARCDWLRFDTAADRLGLIYRTDHHWTAAGAYRGYSQILDMMRLDTPDIGEPLECEFYTVDTVKFNGSFSRFSNYYDIWDSLSFADYGLSGYTVKGSGMKLAEAVDMYYAHTQTSISYEAFYPYFYQIDFPDNDTGRNLLVLGDSFTRAISENLAAHFDTTYVVYPGSGADIGHMIDRKGVTDILILMYSDRLMYTIYNEIDWNKFVTD